MALNVGGRGLAFKEMREMNAPWRTVLHLAERCVLRRGERIPLGRKLYFLERGKVRLTQQSLEGMEKILWYIHEGCLFGETPFFDPMPSEGYFTCSVESVVWAFSPQSLDVVRREHPDLLMNLAQSMARKMRALSHQAASLYLDSVLVRTCKFLAQRIVPGSDPPRCRCGDFTAGDGRPAGRSSHLAVQNTAPAGGKWPSGAVCQQKSGRSAA